VAVVLAVAAFASPGYAITLTFDDLATPNNDGGQRWGPMPASYGGLTWSAGEHAWEIVDGTTFRSTYHNTFGPVGNGAYNGTGYLLVSVSDGLFNFNSVKAMGWDWYDGIASYTSRTIQVRGLDSDGVEVWSTGAISLPAAQVITVTAPFGYAGSSVSQLEFRSSGAGQWWIIDDLAYTPVEAPRQNPIPEPVTMAGVLMGIGGLVGYARKRRKA
jgi:hypothetical protein